MSVNTLRNQLCGNSKQRECQAQSQLHPSVSEILLHRRAPDHWLPRKSSPVDAAFRHQRENTRNQKYRYRTALVHRKAARQKDDEHRCKKDGHRLCRMREDQFIADPAAGTCQSAVQVVFPRHLEQQRKRNRSDAGGKNSAIKRMVSLIAAALPPVDDIL